MKSILSIFLIALFFTASAQDRILKTDGTIITGKVVSFQNNRLVVMQEDETEMTLPRKAVAEIKFDFQGNGKLTAKSVEMPMPAASTQVAKPAPVSTPSSYSNVPQTVKKETSEPMVVQKNAETNNALQSPGEIMGLEARAILSSAPLKERAVGAGRVAVTICLNADGNVVSSKFKAVGSSTIDADLISIAVQNARSFKFEKGNTGDCGVITYRFNID